VPAVFAAVAVEAVAIFTVSAPAAAKASDCLAISEGNWGAAEAVVDAAAPAFAVSAELNHGSFGADLQPIAPPPITKAKLNVRILTRMASVPSNRVLFALGPSWSSWAKRELVRAARYGCLD
jgi:hypothetical protein